MRAGPRRAGSRSAQHPVVDHFAKQMDHLSQCVIDGTEPLTPGEEGLKDLTVMMAIYEAAKTRTTVRLS